MARIAIFDSGVGGLSIYQEVLKQCPHHSYVFVSDNLAFPYGTKAETELITRVNEVVASLIESYQPDLLIVACNTASTLALPSLRDNFKLPIIGVVPAVKPAAKSSISKAIGLLATPGTISRDYTQQLINEFASGCQVFCVGTSELVNIAEDKFYGRELDSTQIEAILEPFIANQSIDTLVLACTHFPLLCREISAIFKSHNRAVELIDSGQAIANRVVELMPDRQPSTLNSVAAFTKQIDNDTLSSKLSRLGFSELETLSVE